MALDEWLFSRATTIPGFIVLRLYTWMPGGITFGCNQKVEKAVFHQGLGETPLIRRVTGGRALYHDPSEITYAVIVNQDGLKETPLTGSLTQSSAAIAEALTAFLLGLGLQSQYLRHTLQSDHRPEYFHSAPCFASAARHEIVSGAIKVVASAQRRIGSTLLQHGSIKLSGVAYHPALDGSVCGPDRRLCLDPIQSQHFHDLCGRFFTSIGKSFGITCEPAELSKVELGAIDRRVESIKENPTTLRDLIKQPGVQSSL